MRIVNSKELSELCAKFCALHIGVSHAKTIKETALKIITVKKEHKPFQGKTERVIKCSFVISKRHNTHGIAHILMTQVLCVVSQR